MAVRSEPPEEEGKEQGPAWPLQLEAAVCRGFLLGSDWHQLHELGRSGLSWAAI